MVAHTYYWRKEVKNLCLITICNPIFMVELKNTPPQYFFNFTIKIGLNKPFVV